MDLGGLDLVKPVISTGPCETATLESRKETYKDRLSGTLITSTDGREQCTAGLDITVFLRLCCHKLNFLVENRTVRNVGANN